MSRLKTLRIVTLLSVLVVPFTADGAGPKTYLGVSGISFDYISFWYAKDYLSMKNTTLMWR